MVSASITRTARETTSTLQNRDIQGVAVIALSAAGGVIVSQIIAEELADLTGISSDPNDGLESLALVVGTKLAVAAGFGVVGTSLGGLGLVAGAFMAIGSLASAGADALDYLLNSAPLGSSQTGARPKARATAVSSRQNGEEEEEVTFRGRSYGGGGTKRPNSGSEQFR